mgnify:CR=1 FL=1
MSDITNYAYIWYKKNPSKLLDFTSEEQDIIFKIITIFNLYIVKYFNFSL